MNDELGRRMDAAVDDVRLPPDTAVTVLHRVGARRRRLTVAVTAMLAVAGWAALLVTQPADDGPDRLVPARASDGVVRDGTRVVGSGRVVRTADGTVQLCAGPEGRADVGHLPGKEPPPLPCPDNIAVDLRGAYDLDLLRDRFEKAGAVEGWATLTGTLTGTYRQRTLTVERQELPPAPDTHGGGWYERSEPPCDPPPGGWPRDPRLLVPVGDPDDGDVNLIAEQPVLDRYRAAHPSRFVDVSLQRPFPDSAVLGVITPDEPARRAVEAALRPTYGERLCVVVSRYTREQVAEADRALRPYTPEADVLGIANTSVRVADGLQREVYAEVVAVTPELQAIADRFPAGLVRLEPTLVPVS